MKKPDTIQASSVRAVTKEGRLFVRLVLSLGVGVAVGLAPFLGNLSVPGFIPLLEIFPRSLRGFLIPVSAFMMGTIAAMVQYYAGRTRSQKFIHSSFRRSSRLLSISFLLLVVSYFLLVVQVPIPGVAGESVVVGLVRLSSCGCTSGSSNLQCVEDLSLFPGAIEGCWGSQQIGLSKAYLSLVYLVATGSFGVIIGLIVLKATVPNPARPKQEEKKGARDRKKALQ